MISVKNNAKNTSTNNDDFTADKYVQLLKIAKVKYHFATYNDIPWDSPFILWRHDLDYSLNRALALSKIENSLNIKSTYFINPHSEFYNIAEAEQFKIIKEILLQGHELGLHFDAAFYNIKTEKNLDIIILEEADYLQKLFKIRPVAFSFHNPAEFHLSCEAEFYGGLVNCYSKRFKTKVAYCSDSNGYWRFRRLYDVLVNNKDYCLQVLTHPGWWQDSSMPPRDRIHRSIYGRANNIMKFYDNSLKNNKRQNINGNSNYLGYLEDIDKKKLITLDYLWNNFEFKLIKFELIGYLINQIRNLIKVELVKNWRIPLEEFKRHNKIIKKDQDFFNLFEMVFNRSIGSFIKPQEQDLMMILLKSSVQTYFQNKSKKSLERECIYLCKLIEKIFQWGAKKNLHSLKISYPATKKDSFIKRELKINYDLKWEKIKKDLNLKTDNKIIHQ